MNPVKMFKLFRAYERFGAIQKEKVPMNTKIAQYVTLIVSLVGTLGVPELASKWMHAHTAVYAGFVAVAIVLHSIFPSIFSEPSRRDEQASGIGSKVVALLVVLGLAMLCASPVMAQTAAAPAPIANLYAAGVSYNTGASPAVAGTALYAHNVTGNTYAFTAIDAVPNTLQPFTVTTNVGVGVAQKVATILGADVFVPTAVGVSWSGSNTGWQWNAGAALAFHVKGQYYVLPSVRVVKSSVSGGSGYQPIIGVLFGWGK